VLNRKLHASKSTTFHILNVPPPTRKKEIFTLQAEIKNPRVNLPVS
jgi:hypothetical protein